jgi:general stress protein 26
MQRSQMLFYICVMSKPTPEKVNPAEVRDRALNLVKSVRFPVLATSDGDQARARPVSPVRTEGFNIYVANLKTYHKTTEIAHNPKVELCYTDADHNQVRITGNAEILDDRSVIEEIWNSNRLLQHYLGSVDNPALIIYKITPQRVRYMVEWALEYYEVEPVNPEA